jgi:short-subunit dehydrogenase
VADVRDRAQVTGAIAELVARLGPVDLLIASAGVCALAGVDDLKVEQVEEILQVNFLGVVYALDAVLPDMLRRQAGQIVAIASLAALVGLPFEGAYCASKAALSAYLESLRPSLRKRGIHVTTVFPGFVQTPMLERLSATAGSSAYPGAVSVERAARAIASAIHRRSRVLHFPWTLSWAMWLVRCLPSAGYDWVMARLAKRFALPY